MNYIIDPDTLESYSIFSEKGLKLLKEYVRVYQEGGARVVTYVEQIGDVMQLYKAEANKQIDDVVKLKLTRVENTDENYKKSVNLGEPSNTYLKKYSETKQMGNLAQGFLINTILKYPSISIIQVPYDLGDEIKFAAGFTD